MMRLFALLLLSWGLLFADAVPGIYIIRMEDDAKAVSVRTTAADRAARKLNVRQAVVQRRAKVVDALDRAMDALVIEAPGTSAQDWESLPGVAKVYPVWERQLHLDHAAGVLGAREAWQRVSRDRAGLGVKIGILDTGIDWEHPGFRDDSLPQLEGYPVGNRDTDLEATNRKIIVARSYENLLSVFGTSSPRDVIGHGTAVAMAAAGVVHEAPIGEISGIAPKAYLGAYKIFAGTEGTTNDRVILRAIDDAIADGMDVINMSFGSAPEIRPDLDPLIDAVAAAAARGVIVVKSAGNEGPDIGSISSTSQSASLINVGASRNDRELVSATTVGETNYPALPAGSALPSDPVTGPVVDAASQDQNGLACGAFPANALNGSIVLILRGTCTFEEKLNNAQTAGAIGAIVYTDDRPVGSWDARNARLPALMVSNASGLRIKAAIAEQPGVTAVLRFRPTAIPVDPFAVSSFSSRGPTSANTIGVDLVAVGQDVYTAAQKSTPGGDVFGADGYTVIDGTSFSAPMVAGAAALTRAARPGLSPRQYKSLLVNTASVLWRNDEVVSVHQAGSGLLNIDRALRAIATAAPSSLSYGAGGSSVDLSRDLTVTNVSGSPDTFQVGVVALKGVAPEPAVDTFTLQPGESRTFAVRLSRNGIAGEHTGFLVVRGSGSAIDLRIPYWYAVRGTSAASISVIFPVGAQVRAGRRLRMYVRLNDDSGVSLTETPPVVTVVDGNGTVENVVLDSVHPGNWRVDVMMAALPGRNTFRIESGDRARRQLSFDAN
jgi:subtilisin family serine protease